jgi:branched-subunit amino acid aminotransferase/4-amino-4-deoxychorismate lyase
MHAWTISGKPTKHIEPWGNMGAFSTLRLLTNGYIPFRDKYITRLLDSAKILEQKWIPNRITIEKRLDEYLSIYSPKEGLIRICIFEESIGISNRPSKSNGKETIGRLIKYRRPIPSAKSTIEKDLYGRLSELDITSEDWIIIDPKENDIRESATANLIFVQGNNLVIPDKHILLGVILRQMTPLLQNYFSITRSIPFGQNLSRFEEILLCGTGRGIAPLTSIPELDWCSRSDNAFKKIRSIYEQLMTKKNA